MGTMNTTRNILIALLLTGLVGIETSMPPKDVEVEAARITISA